MEPLPLSPSPEGRGDLRKNALPEFWSSRWSKRYVLIQKILLPLVGGAVAKGLRGCLVLARASVSEMMAMGER